MGPKIFTARDANALLPRLEEVFCDLDAVRARLKRIKSKTEVLEMLWGEEIQSEENPDHREYLHYTEEVERAKKSFEEASRKFVEMEVVLKSLEEGLIDFYGVLEGRLVFLCWKRGEKAVEYYHHLEDGFAGRQPITVSGERQAASGE